MRILFTGGGTGGHFYPIIAVAAAVNEIAEAEKLFGIEMYFLSSDPYDKRLLFENNIIYKQIAAGKIRRDFSPKSMLKNFLDILKTVAGTLNALWKLYVIYPDVVFGKGGYTSFPTLSLIRRSLDISLKTKWL